MSLLADRFVDELRLRGPRGLVAAAWRTGGHQLRRARLRLYRRERRVWRARLDAWYRPAALIPFPRSGSAPPAGPPPAAQPAPLPRASADDPARYADEPPDEDPWAGAAPSTPEVPLEMVLQLLEETLGAVPIDEHGFRLYRRARPGVVEPGPAITSAWRPDISGRVRACSRA